MKNTIYLLLGLLISVCLCAPFVHADVLQSDGTYYAYNPEPTTSNITCRTTGLSMHPNPSVSSGGNSGCPITINFKAYSGGMSCPSGKSSYQVFYHCGKYCGSTPCEEDPWPPPVEPNTCSNGQVDGDESGIDCGGSCSAECQFYCPSGYEILLSGDGIEFCGHESEPDELLNCPQGSTLREKTDGSSMCLATPDDYIPYGMSDEFYSENFELELSNLDIAEPTDFSGLDTGSTIDYSGESVVNNGDGTETATVSVTTTNSDGSSSTATTTVDRPEGSASGTGFAPSSSSPTGVQPAEGTPGNTLVTGTTATEDNPENYNYDLGSGEGDFDGSLSEDDIPEEDDISDLFTGFLNDSPIATMITGSSIQTSAPVCALHWNYKGKDVVFSFCDEPWPSTLNFMGQILIFLSTVGTYFIIFGKD